MHRRACVITVLVLTPSLMAAQARAAEHDALTLRDALQTALGATG